MTKAVMALTLLLCFPVLAQAQGRRGGPRVGDAAPNFEAKVLRKKQTIKLAKLIKKSDKPIVLIFGSYT